ncbi:hypothetical protein LMH87_000010 [Akanthomyces muscarius]|uniref:Uncharacterized protein n=1 Tax=Akanthomyces muscarius TaxID=2231603 RepID=A0A9W8UNE3_AKAMU|nr:hypothetical protein LMH87_000010 [Akanthomyces muscarius]KAJ4154731.1 hypothetical protein LMH87_000010 [Akanthomyces muscarius]
MTRTAATSLTVVRRTTDAGAKASTCAREASFSESHHADVAPLAKPGSEEITRNTIPFFLQMSSLAESYSIGGISPEQHAEYGPSHAATANKFPLI